MRIAIVDYPGHAFAIQLSRCLARRGHTVLLSYYMGFPSPKGPLERRQDDPETLTIKSVDLDKPFQKFNFFRRRQQEIAVGKAFGKIIDDFAPDIVVACTVPIDTQSILMRHARLAKAASVFWLQDIISIAMREILSRKLPGLGPLVAMYYQGKEARLFRDSDAIVAISEDFFGALADLHLDSSRCYVMPNWAPLPEMPQCSKDNEWSRAHGLVDKKVVLYSGTLGLKHNPEFLARLAETVRNEPHAAVVVVSEGLGTDYLTQAKKDRRLENLVLLPFQPARVLPQVLGAADVLTAFVEPEAGTFSVPSKLLSYFCAGRAVLAGIGKENAAAREIRRHDLGIVVEPNDEAGYLAAASRLFADQGLRENFGLKARSYAEQTFDIEKIASRFETIFEEAVSRHTAETH